MSMHLMHPALSMSGKKKGKTKFRNAEEARKARELEASWNEIQKKHRTTPIVKKITVSSTYATTKELAIPEGRNTTSHIKSRVTDGGKTSLSPIKVYTGDKMLGIGQLHKSNAVPVFRSEDIVDIARMRR